MTKKLLVAAAVTLCAGVACTSNKARSGDDRGLQVTAIGSAVVRYDDVVVTLKGLGRAAGRYEATRLAERSLAPLVAAARRAAPTAQVRTEEPEPRFTTASVLMEKHAFVLSKAIVTPWQFSPRFSRPAMTGGAAAGT